MLAPTCFTVGGILEESYVNSAGRWGGVREFFFFFFFF